MPSPSLSMILLAPLAALLSLASALGALRASRRASADQESRDARIEARLSRLEAAVSRIEAGLGLADPNPKPEGPVDRTSRPKPHPRRPRDSTRAGAKATGATGTAGPVLIAVPDLSGPSLTVGSQAEAARRASASADLARRFARIWSMADDGSSREAIARATGQPIGQVELVLNLRRRLAEASASGGASDEVPA